MNSHKARYVKWAISVFVIYHILAVLLPPLAFQTTRFGQPSPVVDLVIRPFRGYGQFLYLDRGYAFFAPDPGPSHLFQAAVELEDGNLQEDLYPDLDRQWPRLLYHRHFMLAEFLNEVYAPPGPPNDLVEADPEAALIWRQQRGRYEYVRQSIVDHLSHVHDGRPAAILRIEHGIPALQDYVVEPIELDDARLYRVLVDQPLISDEMAPTSDAEVIPASDEKINQEDCEARSPESEGDQ
ncbi:MAG: hypothetical protein AAF802_09005 [Planctomycetota bacterium]